MVTVMEMMLFKILQEGEEHFICSTVPESAEKNVDGSYGPFQSFVVKGLIDTVMCNGDC
jgi:hypothetical protein